MALRVPPVDWCVSLFKQPTLCHLGAKKAALPAAEFLQNWSLHVFAALKFSYDSQLHSLRHAKRHFSHRTLLTIPWIYHISLCHWILTHSYPQSYAKTQIYSFITQHLRFFAFTSQFLLFSKIRHTIFTKRIFSLATLPHTLLSKTKIKSKSKTKTKTKTKTKFKSKSKSKHFFT